jgi:hypothetical protein
MGIVDSIVENIESSGTRDPKLLHFIEEKSTVSIPDPVSVPVVYPTRKKPGRKRKRGPRKKGKELPPVAEKWGKPFTVNDCISAVIDYIQISDGLYQVAHDCKGHGDKKACKALVSVKKSYMTKRKEVRSKCKI